MILLSFTHKLTPTSHSFYNQRLEGFFSWDSSFFYTIDLHKYNSKTKSLLNKRTADSYLIYGDEIGETKKLKKQNPYICIHK